MDLDTLLGAGLVIAISLGTAVVIVAVIVVAHRPARRQEPAAETQDEFTAAVLKWGDMQDRVRK